MNDTRRNQIISIIEKEFIGPDPINWNNMIQSNGEEILTTDPPRTRYIAGVLFPKETTETDVDVNEGESVFLDTTDVSDPGGEPFRRGHAERSDYLEEAEELINRSNDYQQSALSLTVAVKPNDRIFVEVSAGSYTTVSATDATSGKRVTSYPRKAISWKHDGLCIDLPLPSQGLTKKKIPGTGLQFDATYRYQKAGNTIYTFTLENTNIKKGSTIKDDDCYFQVKFRLKSELGFSPLADSNRVCIDDDYHSNQLLYRDVHNYAIGHGCAADWDDGELVSWVETAIFPQYDIKPIVPSTIPGVSLEMLKMSPYGNISDTIKELHLLCKKYREWIEKLEIIKNELDEEYVKTADRHISNCFECLSRMENGVRLLETNEEVRIAFQYMNLAMLMQQLHYNLPLQKWEFDGINDIRLVNPVVMPDVLDSNTWYGNRARYGKWRPFQLAFVLINLHSMYDPNCNERSIVDLIWFPTGGGKTEAYLGLSAYTIFIRRLKNKADKGTAILMRYTLRLLTAQQYERASAMICACDLIRKNNEHLFGNNRIDIGLWVGGTTTPNRVKEALDVYKKLYDGEGSNPFVLLKCPWCGAQMGPVQKEDKQWDLPGYKKVRQSRNSFTFAFRCRNHRCDFSNEDLPLYVIDELIYQKTPTLLLGTVDKFAMLPYLEEAKSIFGYSNGQKKSSPDLIIQDELHLISGPLGSMVGHYETLINELCTTRTGEDEIRPKIIASTATISRAKQQCHALYGCKEDDVFQFPPSGLNAGDSFFANEDKEKNGRRYVGVLATGSSSDATTSIRLYAALLYAAKSMKVEDESKRDPYWTNIGYYNSIRELGQAATWIRADIDQHLDVMYKRRFDQKRYESDEEYQKSRRYIYRDEELTSRISGSDVTASLANLGIKYPPTLKEDGKVKDRPIDICLATNMISVGLDVSRLGLMTVAGQPKTTSEYIQATSRVGRDSDNAPGLVFVLYRPGRPRDKSHYEHFKAYHSRIYCNVEPTSVTPFSAPVRERALHAIMIGMMRLEGDDRFNQDPPVFPNDDLIEKVKHIIENRVGTINADELDATIRGMEYVLQLWKNWNPQQWTPTKNYDWSYADPVPLIFGAGTHRNARWGQQGFPTPTSLRNVDASCEAALLENGYYPKEV